MQLACLECGFEIEHCEGEEVLGECPRCCDAPAIWVDVECLDVEAE